MAGSPKGSGGCEGEHDFALAGLDVGATEKVGHGPEEGG